MAKNVETVSALCVTCGLCCSGALFARAVIDESELPFVNSLGLTVGSQATPETGKIEHNFRLPCRFLEGTACGRYEQKRPNVCGIFFCHLAEQLDEGAVTFDHARQQVEIAKGLVAAIQPYLLDGETLPEANLRLAQIAAKRPLPLDDARFHLQGVALKLHLAAHFRDPPTEPADEGEAPIGAATPPAI